jgi:hypothetical protein
MGDDSSDKGPDKEPKWDQAGQGWSLPRPTGSCSEPGFVEYGSTPDLGANEASAAGSTSLAAAEDWSNVAGVDDDFDNADDDDNDDNVEDLEFVHQGASEFASEGVDVDGTSTQTRSKGRQRPANQRSRISRRSRRYDPLPQQPDGVVVRRRKEPAKVENATQGNFGLFAHQETAAGDNTLEIEPAPEDAPSEGVPIRGQDPNELAPFDHAETLDLEQGVTHEPVLFNAAVRPKRWTWKRLWRRLFRWRRPLDPTTSGSALTPQPYDALRREPGPSNNPADVELDPEDEEGPEMLSAAIGDFLSAQYSWEIHAHRLVSQPDQSYAIAVNREALERKEQLRTEEQRQAAEQSRLRMAAMQFRSLFIRDASHDEAMATGDPDAFDLSVAELEMHERRVRAFRILLLFDAIFFVLLSITWLDALIAHDVSNLQSSIIDGVVCGTNIVIDIIGLRAVSVQSARWLGVFIALYWISLIGTIIAIPLLPLIPLLRFLLLPMAAAIKQFIEFQERQQQQLQNQAMIFV